MDTDTPSKAPLSPASVALLQEEKLAMFLDIDNTILHAIITYDIPYSLFSNSSTKDMFVFQMEAPKSNSRPGYPHTPQSPLNAHGQSAIQSEPTPHALPNQLVFNSKQFALPSRLDSSGNSLPAPRSSQLAGDSSSAEQETNSSDGSSSSDDSEPLIHAQNGRDSPSPSRSHLPVINLSPSPSPPRATTGSSSLASYSSSADCQTTRQNVGRRDRTSSVSSTGSSSSSSKSSSHISIAPNPSEQRSETPGIDTFDERDVKEFAGKPLYCLVKPRPGLVSFLRSARRFFRIYICTFGSLEYATEIRNRLNALIAKGDKNSGQAPAEPAIEAQIIAREAHRAVLGPDDHEDGVLVDDGSGEDEQDDEAAEDQRPLFSPTPSPVVNHIFHHNNKGSPSSSSQTSTQPGNPTTPLQLSETTSQDPSSTHTDPSEPKSSSPTPFNKQDILRDRQGLVEYNTSSEATASPQLTPRINVLPSGDEAIAGGLQQQQQQQQQQQPSQEDSTRQERPSSSSSGQSLHSLSGTHHHHIHHRHSHSVDIQPDHAALQDATAATSPLSPATSPDPSPMVSPSPTPLVSSAHGTVGVNPVPASSELGVPSSSTLSSHSQLTPSPMLSSRSMRTSSSAVLAYDRSTIDYHHRQAMTKKDASTGSGTTGSGNHHKHSHTLKKSLKTILDSLGTKIDERMCVCIDDRLDVWTKEDVDHSVLKIHPYSFFFSHPIYELQAAEHGLHFNGVVAPPKLNLDLSSLNDDALRTTWMTLSSIHRKFFARFHHVKTALDAEVKAEAERPMGTNQTETPATSTEVSTPTSSNPNPSESNDNSPIRSGGKVDIFESSLLAAYLPSTDKLISFHRMPVLRGVIIAHEGKLVRDILTLASYFGATILSSYEDQATHFLVSSTDPDTCRAVRKRQQSDPTFNKNLIVVTCSWITDCARDGAKVNEEPYLLSKRFP